MASTPITLTTYPQDQLEALADSIAVALGNAREWLMDTGTWHTLLDSLHLVALEMNRRHGHASEQPRYEVPNALDTICYAQYDDGMDVTETDLARAYGLLIDKGDADDWYGVEHFDYTPKRVMGILHGMAESDDLKRQLRGLVGTMVDAMAVAPF